MRRYKRNASAKFNFDMIKLEIGWLLNCKLKTNGMKMHNTDRDDVIDKIIIKGRNRHQCGIK